MSSDEVLVPVLGSGAVELVVELGEPVAPVVPVVLVEFAAPVLPDVLPVGPPPPRGDRHAAAVRQTRQIGKLRIPNNPYKLRNLKASKRVILANE